MATNRYYVQMDWDRRWNVVDSAHDSGDGRQRASFIAACPSRCAAERLAVQLNQR